MASDTKPSLNEEEMKQVYEWVDDIPLTRPKRNIARDFSDGVMTAELIKHFFPKMVELHNYSTANSVTHKLYNWNTLNQKVFKRLNFSLSRAEIDGVCNCSPGVIERVLYTLKTRVEARLQHKAEKQAASIERSVHSQIPPTSNPSINTPPQSVNKGTSTGYTQQQQQQQPLPPNGPPPMQSYMSPSISTKNQGPKQQQAQISSPQPVPYSHPSQHVPPPLPNQPPPSYYAAHQSSPPQQHTPPQQQFTPGYYDGRLPGISDPQVALLLEKKDQTINELHAHVENLESRLMKLEQILRIRDSKIQKLTTKLQQAGLA